MVGKNIRNCIQYFVCFHYVHFLNRILSCVYCCNLMCICLSHLYQLYLMCICCTLCVSVYLICISCTLRVFVVLCVYCCSYFRCRTAGQKSISGKSCDRPPRYRFFLVSLCLQANAEMVPKFPSCSYMLLMQTSRLKFPSYFFTYLCTCKITTAAG